MSRERKADNLQKPESQLDGDKPRLETIGDLVELLDDRRRQVRELKTSVDKQFDQFEQVTREPEMAALTFLFKAGLSNNDPRLLSLASELAQAYTQNIPLEKVMSGLNYRALNSMLLTEITGGDSLEVPQRVDVSTFSIALPKKEAEVVPIKETVHVARRAYVKKVKAVEQTEVSGTQEESKVVVTTTENTSESPQDKFLSEHPAIKTFEGLKNGKSKDWKEVGGVYYAVVTGLKTLIVNTSPRVSEPTYNAYIENSVETWKDSNNKHGSVINLNDKRKALVETDLVDFLMFVDGNIQTDLKQGKTVKYEVRRDNPTVEELLAQKKMQRLRQKVTPPQNPTEPR